MTALFNQWNRCNAGPSLRSLVVALVIVTSGGCTDEGIPPGPPPDNDLLLSSSFELNGSPSLDGWLVGDPSATFVERDAPQGGGVWSVRLTSTGSPTTSYLYAPLRDVQTGDRIRVTCSIRARDQAGGGAIELRTGPTLNVPWQKKAVSYDTLWTSVSLVDTVALVQGDFLWLVLTSLNTEVIRRDALFDLVSVIRIRS